MALRPIVRLGHPALRTPAEAVDRERLATAELQTLIDDMLETMTEARGVGLAAPQLGLCPQHFVYAAVVPDSPDTAEAGPRQGACRAASLRHLDPGGP
jgi:peptide deformylase